MPLHRRTDLSREPVMEYTVVDYLVMGVVWLIIFGLVGWFNRA